MLPRRVTSTPFEDLGDIRLPPAAGSVNDQADLRPLGPLYLASELELARLLPAFEMFVGVFISGGIPAELGAAAPKVAQFWRGRHERSSPEERRGFFARLFGHAEGPPVASGAAINTQFENLMIDLAGALYKLDESPLLSDRSAVGLQTRIRIAAAALASDLIPRSHGLTSLLARDVLETTQIALDILKEPTVQRAVGATSVWLAVRNISQRYLNEDPDIGTHVTRGRSGLVLLEWLADHLPQLDGPGGQLATSGDETVAAASEWLEASLSLHEAEAPGQPNTAAAA